MAAHATGASLLMRVACADYADWLTLTRLCASNPLKPVQRLTDARPTAGGQRTGSLNLSALLH